MRIVLSLTHKAFRPGVVDLPPDSNVANLAAITLPENLAEIDVTLPEISLLYARIRNACCRSRKFTI